MNTTYIREQLKDLQNELLDLGILLDAYSFELGYDPQKCIDNSIRKVSELRCSVLLYEASLNETTRDDVHE